MRVLIDVASYLVLLRRTTGWRSPDTVWRYGHGQIQPFGGVEPRGPENGAGWALGPNGFANVLDVLPSRQNCLSRRGKFWQYCPP